MGRVFIRALCQSESSEYESMISLLFDVFICRDLAGSRIWKPSPFGAFSCRSFYRELEAPLAGRVPASHVWIGVAPPRMEAFAWLAVSGKISTAGS